MKNKFFSKRGILYRISWPITHYIVTHLFVIAGYLLFRFLNRTIVLGKENVPQEPNTLLLSNHQSMIDSFLVGIFAYFPRSLIKPFLIPWNPAAEENFYKNPVISWFSNNLKCIPIIKGRKDFKALYKMTTALKKSPLVLFPEGTRSRDGLIGKVSDGAGLLIVETHPKVIPVYLDGMDKLLPIGKVFPRFFKRIYLCFGSEIDLSEYYNKGKSKEIAHTIMKIIMDRISQLRSQIEKIRTN